MEKPVRLDKFLADAGAGTRSEVKKYIQKGQVQVNGKSVKKPELKVTEEDQVVMNGQEIHAAPEYVYYLFNKPAGCVSATEDFRDKTVLDYIEEKDRRKGLFPVGRLDKDTEGFLLITDDGPLAHELLSPKKHVDKTYYAKVSGKVTEEDVVKLAEGVDIGEKDLTRPARLEILSTWESGTESAEAGNNWESEIRLTIHEGKFHQVKRMMEALGKKVTYLKRLSMGPLALPSDLPTGKYRPLTEKELELVRMCKEHNMGFIAMKGLAGGLIHNSKAAMAYMTQFDNVLPIWGIQKISELEEWLSYMEHTPSMDEEICAYIEKEKLELTGDFCRGCGYCMPCPAGIEINTCARMSLLLRRSPSANQLTERGQAMMKKIEGCLHCGACMKKCPYGLNTPKLLEENYEDYKNVLAGKTLV